ncbi:SPOR domain-containing protein [Dechloromonas sp. ZY10]|uniref:SPOR domain-containing protein n=1 Tax=Dechloromonas aquae TaxID=2664436 RepID=UPI003528B60A
MEDNDPQQHLKKRARRRLVGAVAFASVVAVVLPTIMDQEPRQPVQDVEIRIPGQDEKPFAPKFAQAPVDSVAQAEAPQRAPAQAPEATPPSPPPVVVAPATPAVAPSARLVEAVPAKAEPLAAAKPPEKPADKPALEVKASKPADKPSDKPAERPIAKPDEGKRAAAILAGQFGEPATAAPPVAAKGGEHLVLIGAFANEGNVKILKSKLGELNIKTYTEPLDTPQGRKIRLRAGPFPSRDAAEKALEKMRRIGVSGVVAPR